MNEQEVLTELRVSMHRAADTQVERDHYGHYEVPDKQDKVQQKMASMIDYIAYNAARNCE